MSDKTGLSDFSSYFLVVIVDEDTLLKQEKITLKLQANLPF